MSVVQNELVHLSRFYVSLLYGKLILNETSAEEINEEAILSKPLTLLQSVGHLSHLVVSSVLTCETSFLNPVYT